MTESDKLVDIYAELKDIHARIDRLVREIEDIETAFPKDDESHPDYAGHRSYHRVQMKKDEQNDESIAALKRNILTWAAIGILTVVASTVVQVFVGPLLMNLK